MNASDTTQLRQVRTAILGGRPDTSLSTTLYPVYVAVIMAASYGVPAALQLFRSIDEQGLAEHARTPLGAVVAGAAVIVLLALVWLLGRERGPVVPPLPYLELVVASPMRRNVTLARYWRLSLGGSAIGGLLVGAVAGAGMAIANVAPPVVMLPAALGGFLLGLLVAEFWLQGQLYGQTQGTLRKLQQDQPPAGLPATGTATAAAAAAAAAEHPSFLSRRRNALALLDISSLRRQSASNVTMGGAVLAGDLRAIRIDAARPTTHARRTRLKASGPVTVIVRRDVLGLRRAPWAALYGLVMVAAGSAGLMLSLQSPRTPTIAPLIALLICHVGFGAWCEGLRLHADNSGTSRMLGIRYQDTALAHLVVPLSAWLLTAIIVNVGLSVADLIRPIDLAWALGIGALLAGTHLMAAFRGMPPMGVFGPQAGVPAMAFWYAKPLLATLVIGTATTAWAARADNPSNPFTWLLLATALIGVWGMSLVHKRDRRA